MGGVGRTNGLRSPWPHLWKGSVEAKCCYIHAVDFSKCSCGVWHGPRACLMTLCHRLIAAPPLGTPGRAWGQSKLVSWEGKGWPAGPPAEPAGGDGWTQTLTNLFAGFSLCQSWPHGSPGFSAGMRGGPLSPPRPRKVNYRMTQVLVHELVCQN